MKSTSSPQFSLNGLGRETLDLASRLKAVALYVWLSLIGTGLFGIYFLLPVSKKDPVIPGTAVIVLFLAVFLWLKHQDQVELARTPPPVVDPQSHRRTLLVQRLNRRRTLRALVLSLVLPISGFLVIGSLTIFHEPFTTLLQSTFGVEEKEAWIGTWILLLFLLGSIPPAYFCLIEYPVRLLNGMISDTESEIESYEALSEKRRILFLRKQLRNSTTSLAQTYLDNRSDKQRQRVTRWQQEATEILHGTEHPSAEQLNQAQYRISLIEETVRRAEGEKADERSWQWMALVVIAIYLIVITGVIRSQPLMTKAGTDSPYIPYLDITPAILLWGVIGGLAAVLYRFYTTEETIQFKTELRWLVARPIIGVIMAAITCLAVSTGLVVVFFGTTEQANPSDTELLKQPIFHIIAFLAGFSDKFYMGVINLLVGRLGGSESEDSADGEKVQVAKDAEVEEVQVEIVEAEGDLAGAEENGRQTSEVRLPANRISAQ